jgi:hypothetical protein
MNSQQKGAIAEQAIALEATKLGISVLRPVTEQMPYDLVFDLGDEILRVQCKWATRDGGVIRIPIGRCYHSPTRGYVRARYSPNEIDAIACYCADLERCYLIRDPRMAGQNTLHLRLDPTGNNQLAAVNWAADYELGAVAQLEERRRGTAKAEGSSPSSSTSDTNLVPLEDVVGMDAFFSRLAHYVRHAEAGNEILVTRWGRPVARLGPPPTLPES